MFQNKARWNILAEVQGVETAIFERSGNSMGFLGCLHLSVEDLLSESQKFCSTHCVIKQPKILEVKS